MNFDNELKNQIEIINDIIEKYLPHKAEFQKRLVQAMNYSMLAGGKRIRPLLMLQTYRMFGGKSAIIEPFMAAMEMIHTHSLVHDDLPSIDNDEYRRGQKTTHMEYGEAMAVLAGDGLLNYAYETVSRSFAMEPENLNIGVSINILAKKTGVYGMLGGQSVDVESAGQAIEKEQLLFIYRLKTGALIEASMMIGAALSGASGEEVKQIETIASDIGLAFQIQDDILDVTGTAGILGKPVKSDEKNLKTTYVTLTGLKEAKKEVEMLSNRAIAGLDALSARNEFLRELIIQLINREK